MRTVFSHSIRETTRGNEMSHLKRRSHKRLPVSLEGEVIAGSEHFPAHICNISKNSLFTRIAFSEEQNKLKKSHKIQLKIKLPSGERMRLFCRQIWSEKITPRSLLMISGLKVIDPTRKFRQLLHSLN